jgi:putative tryptophan/tyrosine transport system substrate-binding protein
MRHAMTRSVYTNWLWLVLGWCLLLLFGLRGDAPSAARALTVAYVGAASAANDPGYVKLQHALTRLSTDRAPRLKLAYRPVKANDTTAAAAQSLRSVPDMPPDIWVAPSGNAALAVRQADARTPLVFASYPDPVRSRIVNRLDVPGNRAAGIWLDDNLHSKRLELLLDGFPMTRKVGILADRSWLESFDVSADLLEPAKAMGITLHLFIVDEPRELPAVMDTALAHATDGWYIPATYLSYQAEGQILAALTALGHPAIHSSAQEAKAGATLAYWVDTSFAFDALAALILRIAAGEDPGTIPVQRPRRHILAVTVSRVAGRLQAAPSLLRRADILY